ncbi:hypothetical protein [Streptomyces fructofermentans]|nr:hypothetical protein [Streptomyces fructofermentans]
MRSSTAMSVVLAIPTVPMARLTPASSRKRLFRSVAMSFLRV